ncbi:hypothetical protein [Caenispirillum salinarum]|uniref:hypothetical protein n=1 Tax=Caenispirillum salinarum TaxID=859058 RepID=UPI00384C9196
MGKGFRLTFFAGAGGLIAAGQWWPDAPWWVVVGWPLLCMTLYHLWGRKQDPKRKHRDVLGDSLYFLGFLFTLTSLAASLLGMLAAPEEGIAAAHLLGRFGVALTTTIYGFYLRTMLSQLVPRIDQEEQEARWQIHENVQTLTYNLTKAVDLINEASGAASASIRAAGETIEQGFKETLDETRKNISANLDASLKEVMEEYKKSAAKIAGTTNENAESIRTSMQNGTERLSKAIGDLEEQIRTFRPPEEHVHVKLDKLFSGLAGNIASLDARVQDAAAKMQAAVEEFQGFSKTLSGANANMGRVRNAMDKFAASSEAGAAAIGTGAEAFERIDGSMAAAVQSLSQAVAGIEAASATLNDRMASAATVWEEHTSGFAEASAQGRERLNKALETDLAQMQRAQEQMRAARESVLKSFQEAAEESTQAVQQHWNAEAQAVYDKLTAAAHAIAADFSETMRTLDDALATILNDAAQKTGQANGYAGARHG